MENRCVSCGEIIPEGRMVCPNCENKVKEVKTRGGAMVPWYWLPIAMVVGGMIAIWIIALTNAGR